MSQHHSILGWAKTCYGIDLQADTPVIVRGELSHGKVDCAPITPDGQSFLDDQRKGVPTVACLSPRESFLRRLSAPFPSTAKAEKVLPSLIDIDLPFPFEDCVYDISEMKKVGNKVEMIVAVARRKDAEAKLAQLADTRLDPHALDHEGLALWTQSLCEAPVTAKQGKAPRAVVYLGKDRASLVLGQGESLISAHAIDPDNPQQICRLLNKQFGPSDQNQESGIRSQESEGDLFPTPVCHSVAGPASPKVGSGFRPQPSPRPSINWFWAGPGARAVNPLSALRAELNKTWPGPSVVHDQPDAFLARALVTRALSPGPLRCNLRTGDMIHKGVAHQQSSLQRRAASILLASGLLLCAANWTTSLIADRKMASLDQTFADIRDGLMGHRLEAKGQDAITKVKEKVADTKASLHPFVTPFSDSILSILKAIQQTGKKYDLKYDKLFVTGDQVFIRGTSPDWDSSEHLASFLAGAGYRVINKRKDALADERIPFTVESEETP